MVHTNLGDEYTVIDGKFVSQRISRIVESIHEYDENLRVDYIPQGAREEGDSAFRIVYVTPNLGLEQVIFHVKTEEEFDARVLMRIIQNDQLYGNGVKKSDIETFMETERLLKKQAWMDQMEEAADIAYHVFKSHLNTYKVNDELTIKDGIPFNANKLKD